MKKIIPPILLSVCLAWLPFKADSAIDITDFGDLNYPFSALNSTKYRSTTDWLHGDTFFGARKQAVVTRVMDQVFSYFGTDPAPAEMGYNILEIGTGRGFLTSRIARHIYEKRLTEGSADYLIEGVTNPYAELDYGGAVVMTIDNWEDREAETIESHEITIPLRQTVGQDPANGLVAETDVPQMLSNLLHEATRVAGDSNNQQRNTFLDMIQIPIKNSDQAATGGTVTGEQYINAVNADPFFDPIANPSDLLTVRQDYNGTNPFAMIVVDTDTRNEIQFANMLLRAYNVLPVGGVLVVDDINWRHQSDVAGARPMGVGFELFLQTISRYLFDSHPNPGNPAGGTGPTTLTDANPQAYHVVNYDAEGNPQNLTDYGPDVLLSVHTYNGQNLPVLEYHAVWETDVPWLAVFRKVGVDAPLESMPAPYTGGSLVP